MRKITALTLLGTLAVLASLIVPMITVIATAPTEVERLKDVYYFRIHGKPIQTGLGEAVWTYKNLSPSNQEIEITVDGFTIFKDMVLAGTTADGQVDKASNTEITFKVYINTLESIGGLIWIPPTTN